MDITSSTVISGIPPSLMEEAVKVTAQSSSSGRDFSTGHIFAWMIFGLIGVAAFGYGRKQGSAKPMLVGVALMIYPYGVTNLLGLWLVGIALTCYLLYSRN